MKLPTLRTAAELRDLVREVGMIPLFRNKVPGFSVEELTAEGYWFAEDVDGPWQWRQQIAGSSDIAYAKLFNNNYGFVAMDIYPHFANYRREGYDFDARFEDGLVRGAERRLYDLIAGGLHLSSDLRKAYTGKAFESVLTALHMRTYVTCAGFTQRVTKNGKPYGWETTVYDISEALFGDKCTAAYDFEPMESYEILKTRLSPWMDSAAAEALLKI